MPQPRGCHRRRRSLRVSAGRVAGVGALIAGVLISGAPASAQTLTESFAYAYNNNPQLLAQRCGRPTKVYRRRWPTGGRR